MWVTRDQLESEKKLRLQAYQATMWEQGNIYWKDPVPNVASLPLLWNSVDDHREVEDDGFVRRWNGTERVLVSGSWWGSATLTEDVTSMFDIGGIEIAETLPVGTTFTEFVKSLLLSTFYPTFTNPTF